MAGGVGTGNCNLTVAQGKTSLTSRSHQLMSGGSARVSAVGLRSIASLENVSGI